MRKFIVAASLVAALGLAALTVQAVTDQPAGQNATAQSDVLYQCPMHPEVISTNPGKCPKCGMDLVPRTKMQIMAAAHQAAGVQAQGAGASAMPGMPASMAAMHGAMLRQRMMLTVRINKADPAAMLAMSEPLKLTKAQTTKLDAIADDARKKALAVLTKEQKATLDTVATEPASLIDLHRAAMPAQQGHMQLPAGHPALPAPAAK